MIRVLHSVSNMDRAGLETMLMNYYRHMDREIVQFDFLANKAKPGAYEEEIKQMGGRIFVSPGFHPAKLFQYREYMRHLFLEHPEIQIVHAHNGALAYYALREAKRNQIVHRIAHSHNSKINFDWKWPIKQYCKARMKGVATDFFGCGKCAASFYFGKKIVDNKGYTTIRNAIDERNFLFRSEIREKLRIQYGVTECFVIGHVGRFMYQKNHTFLIDIFAEVYKQKKNAVLMLIGEGKLEKEIRKKISRLGLEKNVIFTGSIPNVNEMYQMMDVFVLPSRYEGLPVVGIEAQASGLYTIFSDTITKEVAITDRSVFVPLAAPASQWAACILKVAKKHERKNMEEEIRKAGYSICKEAKRLQNLYCQMVE